MVTWPLFALFGPVVAWNLFVLGSLVAAGAAALAWLRALGLGRAAALAGGLAFALAPYRVEQSSGHLLGAISLLLPVALWAFEKALAARRDSSRSARRRARSWDALAAVALASIAASGQVNLALGAIPFFALYAICRTRDRKSLRGALAAIALSVLAGFAVQRAVIAGSLDAGGRSLAEVRFYSAELLDFVSRTERHGSESFVLLGWALPLVAIGGLVLLVRARRWGLTTALAVGALVPALLALGTNFPLYEPLWNVFPPLRYPRVPERLMPIACLALAALVAIAVDRAVGWRARLAPLVAAVAVVGIVLDTHAGIFGRSAADPGNQAYAAVRAAPPGRHTELPVFLPDVHYGSVYDYYNQQAPRERTGGYSTLASGADDAQARSLEPLNCGDWTQRGAALLEQLDVSVVTLHRGQFTRNVAVPDRSWYAWQGLLDNGWRPSGPAGTVTAFVRGSGPAPANPLGEPGRTSAHYCQGWYGPGTAGIPMSRKRAPFWVHGAGALALRLLADEELAVRVSVDGDEVLARRLLGQATLEVPLAGARWHLVVVDVDRLVERDGRRIGARLLELRLDGARR